MSGHTSRNAGTKEYAPDSGEVHREEVEGETTKTGAPKEKFGTGRAAQSEAGSKGGAISAERPEEARKESARKAARTRAERYGDQLKISDPENDEYAEMGSGEHPGGKDKDEEEED